MHNMCIMDTVHRYKNWKMDKRVLVYLFFNPLTLNYICFSDLTTPKALFPFLRASTYIRRV